MGSGAGQVWFGDPNKWRSQSLLERRWVQEASRDGSKSTNANVAILTCAEADSGVGAIPMGRTDSMGRNPYLSGNRFRSFIGRPAWIGGSGRNPYLSRGGFRSSSMGSSWKGGNKLQSLLEQSWVQRFQIPHHCAGSCSRNPYLSGDGFRRSMETISTAQAVVCRNPYLGGEGFRSSFLQEPADQMFGSQSLLERRWVQEKDMVIQLKGSCVVTILT